MGLDFFTHPDSDPWSDNSNAIAQSSLDEGLQTKMLTGPLEGRTDIEAAIALADLVREEMEKYGTDSTQQLTNSQIALAVTALRAVTKRLNVTYEPPFSADFRVVILNGRP